jgi:hypothetical protein
VRRLRHKYWHRRLHALETMQSGHREEHHKPPRQATFGQTARAVLWSFLGVRRKSDYERDAAQLNPVHVIVMGVIAAAVFVITLVVIVNIVAG